MGQAIGAIGSGLAKAGTFAKDAVVAVGKDGGKGATTGQKLFTGGLGGGLQGFSNMEKQNGQQQGGGQQQISVQQAPQLQNGFDPNYLMKLKQQQQGGNGFYGGY